MTNGGGCINAPAPSHWGTLVPLHRAMFWGIFCFPEFPREIELHRPMVPVGLVTYSIGSLLISLILYVFPGSVPQINYLHSNNCLGVCSWGNPNQDRWQIGFSTLTCPSLSSVCSSHGLAYLSKWVILVTYQKPWWLSFSCTWYPINQQIYLQNSTTCFSPKDFTLYHRWYSTFLNCL